MNHDYSAKITGRYVIVECSCGAKVQVAKDTDERVRKPLIEAWKEGHQSSELAAVASPSKFP